MLANFQNFFTDRLTGKFATKVYLKIEVHELWSVDETLWY